MTTTLTDAMTITGRDLVHWVRNPSVIIASVAFPVMFILLGFVFGSAMIVPGGADYREFLMPGMFAQGLADADAALATVNGRPPPSRSSPPTGRAAPPTGSGPCRSRPRRC